MSLTRVPAPPPCDFVMAAMRFKKASRRCDQSSRGRDGKSRLACLRMCGIPASSIRAPSLKSLWSTFGPGWAGSCAKMWRCLPKNRANPPICREQPRREPVLDRHSARRWRFTTAAAALPMAQILGRQFAMKPACRAAARQNRRRAPGHRAKGVFLCQPAGPALSCRPWRFGQPVPIGGVGCNHRTAVGDLRACPLAGCR
jgi:hypothetical protein